MSEWTCQKCGKVCRENADFCLGCAMDTRALVSRLDQLFIADDAPLGTVVQIGYGSAAERMARSEFHRYLFQYFEQLTSGQTGWGVDFNTWLEMARGWRHLGKREYERVRTLEEEIASERSTQPEHEQNDQTETHAGAA